MFAPLIVSLVLQPSLNPSVALARSAFATTAPPEVVVDVADGSTIKGVQTFKVIVRTDDIVTRVELYINGTLTTDQQSTPYTFTIDTINQPDGKLEVKFIAYTDQGGKGTKTLNLTVDNGLSKGAAFHVQAGLAAVATGDAATALAEGRVALKIDKTNKDAKILMARAYIQEKKFDSAQSEIDDILADDPKNQSALDLAGAIGVQEAFIVYDKSEKKDAALAQIEQAFKYAIDNRQSLLLARLDAATSAATPDPFAIARAALNAHRYSIAIQALQPVFEKNEAATKVANLLAFAQLRAGRFEDMHQTLDLLQRSGNNTYDAYSYALLAVLAATRNDDDASNTAMEQAILNDMSNLGVRTAQASIALKENKDSALTGMVTSLSQDAGQLTEVNYLVSALSNRLKSYQVSRTYCETSLLAEPTNYDMYVEQGNEAVGLALQDKSDKDSFAFQLQEADMFFRLALDAKGDSYEALTGRSIVAMIQKNVQQALQYAQAAVAAQPNYAAAQYALAGALSLAGQDDAARKAADIAAKIDKARLDGAPIPSGSEAWSYFNSGGRTLVMTQP